MADLSETPLQLMGRIEAQENLAAADQVLMNLSSSKPGILDNEKTLAEQGIENETVLALDLRSGSQYFLKVQISLEETIQLQYNFNDTIEKLKQKVG